jgi:hypothetical protein
MSLNGFEASSPGVVHIHHPRQLAVWLNYSERIPPVLPKIFQAIFEEIFSLIETSLRTNQQATESRNLLLPRLIFGKLSVDVLDIEFPPSMREEASGTAVVGI